MDTQTRRKSSSEDSEFIGDMDDGLQYSGFPCIRFSMRPMNAYMFVNKLSSAFDKTDFAKDNIKYLSEYLRNIFDDDLPFVTEMIKGLISALVFYKIKLYRSKFDKTPEIKEQNTRFGDISLQPTLEDLAILNLCIDPDEQIQVLERLVLMAINKVGNLLHENNEPLADDVAPAEVDPSGARTQISASLFNKPHDIDTYTCKQKQVASPTAQMPATKESSLSAKSLNIDARELVSPTAPSASTEETDDSSCYELFSSFLYRTVMAGLQKQPLADLIRNSPVEEVKSYVTDVVYVVISEFCETLKSQMDVDLTKCKFCHKDIPGISLVSLCKCNTLTHIPCLWERTNKNFGICSICNTGFEFEWKEKPLAKWTGINKRAFWDMWIGVLGITIYLAIFIALILAQGNNIKNILKEANVVLISCFSFTVIFCASVYTFIMVLLIIWTYCRWDEWRESNLILQLKTYNGISF